MKVCFIIPIYGADFKYLKNILLSKEKYEINADIYFMMSNSKEDYQLKNLCKNLKVPYKTIIVNNGGVIVKNTGYYNHPVVHKKLYGMIQLLDKYEYYCCVDSEIQFIKNVNIFELCNKYYDKKTIYASDINAYIYHNNIHMKFYNEEEHKKIKIETNDLIFWSWFNNIPIYKNDILKSFFNYINLNKDTLTDFMINFKSNFELMMYEYYLILHYDFKMKIFNKKDTESIIERANKYDIDIINEINPYWFPKKVWDNYINNLNLNKTDIFIIFHLDRT